MRRVWYGAPLMALAECPAPQSLWLAMWPPQASTTVELVAVKLIDRPDEECSALKLPWLMYIAPVIEPFHIVSARSPLDRALKLAAGMPATVEPVELGAGIEYVDGEPKLPASPASGSTVSAACPNGCGSSRS